LRKQLLAGLGEGEAARGSVDETHAQPFFEAANAVAQRRDGEAETRRGGGKASLFGDCREGRHLVEVASAHPRLSSEDRAYCCVVSGKAKVDDTDGTTGR
jgi:hypothetical protein